MLKFRQMFLWLGTHPQKLGLNPFIVAKEPNYKWKYFNTFMFADISIYAIKIRRVDIIKAFQTLGSNDSLN